MYKLSNSHGSFADPIYFTNPAMTSNNIYNTLKDQLKEILDQNGVSYRIKEDQCKSGGLFGTVANMLVVSHPTESFCDLALIIDDQMILCHLFGFSAELTKAADKQNASGIMKHLIKVDDLKIQKENMWRQSIVRCLESLIV